MQRVLQFVIAGMFLALVTGWCAAWANPAPGITPEVEAALLKEDWPQVAKLLPDAVCSNSPVARIIKGHACLALNQNNDSVMWFLSAGTPDDSKAWHEWSKGFQQAHGDAVIVAFNVGDSLARLEKYEEASAEFKKGLAQRPKHALLLNAQGVCYAKLGKLVEARQSFDAAIQAPDVKLADAYANLGAYWIERKEGAEGAISAFTSALAASPSFAIATHGRLCLELVLGKAELTPEISDANTALPIIGDVMDENIGAFINALAQVHGVDTNKSGNFLQRTYGPRDLNTLRSHLDNGFKALKGVDSWKAPTLVKNLAKNWIENNLIYKPLENAARYNGTEATGKVIDSRSPDQQQTIANRFGIVVRWQDTSIPATRGGSAALQAGSSFVPSTTLPSVAAKGGLMVASAAGGYWATRQEVRQQTAKELAHSMKNQFSSGPSGPASQEPAGYIGSRTYPGVKPDRRPAGGADLDMTRMNRDDGNWPFKALYGLAYGMTKGKLESCD